MEQLSEFPQTEDVWVVVEHSAGKIQEITLEMLWEGKRLADRLGGNLCAVILGNEVTGLVEEIENKGARVIYLVQDTTLGDFTSDTFASVLNELIKQYHPLILILGATANGSELAARVATQLRAGLVAGCTALDVDNKGQLRATRPIYEDRVYSTVAWRTETLPRIATLQPGAIGAGELSPAETVSIIEVRQKKIIKDNRIRTMGYTKADPRTLDLTEGDIVLAGGHGARSEQSWHLIEQLAGSLGAVIGGTRRSLDNGRINRDYLIGQTGKTIKPKLYLAAGISGASHHTEGMKGSEHIIAINNDPAAQVFKLAHLCIVADLNEMLPELIKKLIQHNSTSDEGVEE